MRTSTSRPTVIRSRSSAPPAPGAPDSSTSTATASRRRRRRTPRRWGLGLRWGLAPLLLPLSAACALAAAPASPPSTDGAAPEEPTSFQIQEVFDLLKANLAGTSEAELNRAAVRGLLDQLAGKVSWVGQSPAAPSPAATHSLSGTLYDGRFASIRIPRLTEESASQFNATLRQLQSSNSNSGLKGLILDLRFTSGQNYEAAVALADRFLAQPQPLVDWGEGWRNSTTKTDAVSLPLAVLVNSRTTGAAEVLAGILRHREVGLLIGGRTAGQASMSREFTLKTGQKLRVAVAPVKVAAGQELPFSGMKPDIEVDLTPEEEVAWYEDPFRPASRPSGRAGLATSGSGAGSPGGLAIPSPSASPGDSNGAATNRAPRRRMNEAELVRMSREGQPPDRDGNTNSSRIQEPPPPQVNDPALARALDLLKGLAVVQQTRTSR